MAETSGTAAPPPAASCRPDAVAFLPRTRFVRLVAAIPKLPLHRRVLTAVSPPLVPEPKYPDYANQHQPPSSPTHDADAPEKPDAQAEQPPHEKRAAADAVAAVAGEHQAHQHNDFTVYDGDARTDAECWCSATPEARVEETTKRPEALAAIPKLPLHRRVLTAVSPPLVPEPKYPDYANQHQPPSSPTHDAEAPEKPDAQAEQPPHEKRAAADAVAAVAGEHQAHQHNDFTVYDGDARTDAECWCSATPEARVEETPKRPEALAETPKKAKRQEAKKPKRTPDAAAAAAAAKAVAGKYWAHRHNLFSLYDRGVRMDAEGWYSITPESVAAAQAARAAPADLVVDAFAGVGGNSIQFAARGCYVIAVDIDPRKVELARHNARIYGVEGMIEFVVGDFFRLAPYLKADLVFLSPPWGGPSYNKTPVYTLDMLKPKDGYTLFQTARKIAPSIMMFLPRNVDISQVEELSWLSSPPLDFESEENYVQHRFKGITAYFRNVAR